jgi:hypothetical protein
MINRVLTNTVRVKAEEPVEEVQQPTTVEPAAETPKEPSIDEIIAKEQEAARARVREVESTYAELEMKRKLEHDQLLSQIAQEKKAREEIERKLREAAVTRVASGPENVQEEDEDLASDYAKNTRKMVSELKETISSLATGDPRIQTLEEKIQKYEQMEADRKRVDEQERADRKRKEAEQRISNEVKSLQSKYTELQSENDFIKMSEDFNSFRTALVNAVGATTQADQDRMLMTYFDENRGRELREAVKEQGVVPPKDYDKFIKIAELIDMTNGIEYDPILERFVDIKNANGETVRYRSIEEAYRVKNFNNELINTKRKSRPNLIPLIVILQSSIINRLLQLITQSHRIKFKWH